MLNQRNPYTLNFGRIPNEYIGRDIIISELRPTDKWFMSFIIKKDEMSVAELLEITKKKHNEWSSPRKRLIEKGILDDIRGTVSIKLPRFAEFVKGELEF